MANLMQSGMPGMAPGMPPGMPPNVPGMPGMPGMPPNMPAGVPPPAAAANADPTANPMTGGQTNIEDLLEVFVFNLCRPSTHLLIIDSL